MPSIERSFSDVLQDIIGNLQDIVRAEIRLLRTEVQQVVAEAKAGLLLLSIAAITALFSLLFFLLAAVAGLSYVMAPWCAASTVAAILAIGSIATALLGSKMLKKVAPIAPKTVESLKENLEWIERQIK